MKRERATGVSLIEILVVMVVLGIILAVAAPSFSDLLNRRRVKAVASQISTDLAYIRTEAALRPYAVLVYFGGNTTQSCYTLAYDGGTGVCDCTAGAAGSCGGSNNTPIKTEAVPSANGVTFKATTPNVFATARGVIQFHAPQLTVTPINSYVDVCGRSSNELQPQLRVELSPLGRISTCSPNGSYTGFGPCSNAQAATCS